MEIALSCDAGRAFDLSRRDLRERPREQLLSTQTPHGRHTHTHTDPVDHRMRTPREGKTWVGGPRCFCVLGGRTDEVYIERETRNVHPHFLPCGQNVLFTLG